MQFVIDWLLMWVLPPILVMWGIGSAWMGFRLLRKAGACRHWPSVRGVILRSELTEAASSDEGTLYHAEISYGYEVYGRHYEGTQIILGDYTTGDRIRAERRVARYPKGAVVPVYHDPDNAAESILMQGSRDGIVTFLMMGATLVLAGVALAIFMPDLLRGFRADPYPGARPAETSLSG
jgi:hypothetical protein